MALDTPALRAALEARLADQSADVRDEALVGLAQRGDVRMRGRIRAELARDSVGILAVEAAQALGDRSLLPDLIALRDREGECDEHFRSVLDDAIAALGG